MPCQHALARERFQALLTFIALRSKVPQGTSANVSLRSLHNGCYDFGGSFRGFSVGAEVFVHFRKPLRDAIDHCQLERFFECGELHF